VIVTNARVLRSLNPFFTPGRSAQTELPKHASVHLTHQIHGPISRTPQCGAYHVEDLDGGIIYAEVRLYALLLVTAAVAIAAHDDTRNDSDVAQTLAARVLPHVAQAIRLPNANTEIRLGK